MKKQIRIRMPHGTATVDEDCPSNVIDALKQMSNMAFKQAITDAEYRRLIKALYPKTTK